MSEDRTPSVGSGDTTATTTPPTDSFAAQASPPPTSETEVEAESRAQEWLEELLRLGERYRKVGRPPQSPKSTS